MINICHNCVYHEKCMAYRYSNVRTKNMKKIHVKENKEGRKIIYVEKCNKFIGKKFKYYPERLREKKEEYKKRKKY